MTRGIAFAVLVVMLTAAVSPSLAADAAPTTDQLNELFAERKYQDLLTRLNKILSLKGPAAGPYDRYELLTLRGETYLRLKAMPPAADAFGEAARATDDPKKSSTARATELLIRQSGNGRYAPRATDERGKPFPPIDVIDPDSRTQAMNALLVDVQIRAGPLVDKAMSANTLAPIADVAEAIDDLRSVELVATGKDEKTTRLAGRLGQRARELLAHETELMSTRVVTIESQANLEDRVTVRYKTGAQQSVTQLPVKRGLTPREGEELRAIVINADKIASAARELAEALGGDAADLSSVADNAEAARDRAKKVLETPYTGGRVGHTAPAGR